MKKIILAAFLIGTMMSSCSNNGNSAETSEAETVEVVETAETVTFGTASETSAISWRASHLGGAEPRFGKISLKEGSLSVTAGELTNATVVIDMASLTVENFVDDEEKTAKLTGHLKDTDLFDIAKYPTSKFELTKIEKAEGEYNSKVTGNLTILDATKSITFSANVTLSDTEVSIKSEDFSVDRTDWGLSYHMKGSEGVPVDYLIANDIGFTINVTMLK